MREVAEFVFWLWLVCARWQADEAGHESDRQRVMMQIVQELCKRPGLNRTGFDMPTIYIPNPNGKVGISDSTVFGRMRCCELWDGLEY